jgi:hypothetical protein
MAQETRVLILLITSLEAGVSWGLVALNGLGERMEVLGERSRVTCAVRLLSKEEKLRHKYAQVALGGT